jgi:acetylglutamate kinase
MTTGHTSPTEHRTKVAATMGKARILMEAMPYIRRFAGATVVIKYGGSAMVDPALQDSFAADVTLLSLVGLRPVIVHGGGPQISKALDRAGIEATWVDGLRVTDASTIGVVQEVLAGQVNPSIVRNLVGHGAKAVGMTGIDGGLLTAEPREERLGFVGRVTAVDTNLVGGLLDQGVVPVIAPIARGVDGAIYNLNADTAAAAIARNLGAQKLIYLTDVEGLYRDHTDDSTLLSRLVVDEARALVDELDGGMRPKVESSVAALDGGVRQVHILDGRIQHSVLLEIFTPEGIGTMIVTPDWTPVRVG